MKLIFENKIIQELVNSFYEEMSLELAERVEEVNYINLFDCLKEWHLLRALGINRHKVKTNNIHPLD